MKEIKAVSSVTKHKGMKKKRCPNCGFAKFERKSNEVRLSDVEVWVDKEGFKSDEDVGRLDELQSSKYSYTCKKCRRQVAMD